MQVIRDGRRFTVKVTSDGAGSVSHAGSALLAGAADKTGLTRALSARLRPLRRRGGGHDPGRVVRDLAVVLADGGDCLSDLSSLSDQAALFGEVASRSTAFRVIDMIASDPGGLERLRAAHAAARTVVWELAGAPERLTIDLDATLIASHSEKEGTAGTFKGGYGFHPMLAYAHETAEALGAELRPGNAGANTAADQIAVLEHALAQIPAEHVEGIELLLRADTAGATHELLAWAREHRVRYSVGYELTEAVRAAILATPQERWLATTCQDGSERPNGQVCEITAGLQLSTWPSGSRMLVRRERPHPGAQLSLFDTIEGMRHQVMATDTPPGNGSIQHLEARHRAHARVEDRIRTGKDTGFGRFPSRVFAINQAWLQLALTGIDLLAWTQPPPFRGEWVHRGR